MDRATQVVHGSLPAVERATIHAYDDPTPGPVYYQRFAHPVGLEAERLLGELEGGRSLLFGSGSAATIALVLALLEPDATVAIADGGYWARLRYWAASSVAGVSRWSRSIRPRVRRHGPVWCGSSHARTRR
jgi:cystathionine beta-lyase/cystathionine gamma-synthase